MHEIGIVDDVVGAIRSKLKESDDGSKVKKVNIVIGELEQVLPEHFEFHFRKRTKGTILARCELSFKRVKARFRCLDCGHEFSIEEGILGCPKCGSKMNSVVAGRGVSVESVEVSE